MQNHFMLSEIAEARQAEEFMNHFGVQMDPIIQGPGVCGDYVIIETTNKTKKLEKILGTNLLSKRIEFKNDVSSLQYGSFYMEYAQTSDYWWVSNPSGHHKAILEGCILVISSGDDCYVLDEEAYFRLIANTLRTVSTKPLQNGNLPGMFTKGRIVSLKDARKYCAYFYTMSEHSL